MTHLGIATDVKALRGIFDPDGLYLIDVGCGDGTLARKLAWVGASVMGVEPDPIQARKNARAMPADGVEFVQARANDLPVADYSVDGVIFSLSLHHVPGDEMRGSLEEARRVLKPSGFLAVVEPLAEGSYNRVIELFHDETEVRNHAIEALEKFARPQFAQWQQYFYTTETHYASFDDFAEYYATRSYHNFDSAMIRSEAVQRRFEANCTGDGYVLSQPMRVDFYSPGTG